MAQRRNLYGTRRRTHHAPHRRPLRFEPLEDRRLLATFTVDSVLDVVNLEDNFLTLREAIQSANLNPGADTIEFAPALTASGPATILLTMGELVISDIVSIDGPGASLLTIDAQLQSRIFSITQQETTGDVTIAGLALMRGRTTGDNLPISDTTFSGGAIRSVSTGELALRSIYIGSSSTTGVRAPGGAVFAAGPLSVINSRIIGNSTLGGSSAGGGLFVNGLATIVDSTVSQNLTFGNLAGGAGIRATGNVNVTDSHVTENKTIGNQSGGGGAYAGGNITLVNTTAAGNETTGTMSPGGALHSPLGEITLINSAVSGNSTSGQSSQGGGARAQRVTLFDSVVERNETMAGYSRGGGISADSLEAVRAVIAFNLTSGNVSFGGGAAVDGTLMLTDSLVLANKTVGSLSPGGGLSGSGDTTLIQCTVSGNHTTQPAHGGGIFVGGDLTLLRTTISGNNSAATGGGVFISGLRNLSIYDSTISGNSAVGEGGGVVHPPASPDAGTALIERSTITANSTSSALANGGGGIAIVGHDTTIRNSVIAGNSAARINPDFVWRGPGSLVTENTLIGNVQGSTLTEAPVGSPDANGNLVGGPVHGVIDPLLGPLAANGGPTMTHALLPGSPALDAGDPNAVAGMNGVPEFDQRGVPRSRVANGDDVPEARIDMGAFEWQPNPLAGDYNFDGVVDTADVVVWRKTVGSTTDLRADGDGDGDVDADDHAVWAANFGNAIAFPLSAVTSSGRQPPALPGVSAAVGFASPEEASSPEWHAQFERAAEPGAVGVLVGSSVNANGRRLVRSRLFERTYAASAAARSGNALLAIVHANENRVPYHEVDAFDVAALRSADRTAHSIVAALDIAFTCLGDE